MYVHSRLFFTYLNINFLILCGLIFGKCVQYDYALTAAINRIQDLFMRSVKKNLHTNITGYTLFSG